MPMAKASTSRSLRLSKLRIPAHLNLPGRSAPSVILPADRRGGSAVGDGDSGSRRPYSRLPHIYLTTKFTLGYTATLESDRLKGSFMRCIRALVAILAFAPAAIAQTTSQPTEPVHTVNW